MRGVNVKIVASVNTHSNKKNPEVSQRIVANN